MHRKYEEWEKERRPLPCVIGLSVEEDIILSLSEALRLSEHKDGPL
jgi:hypothetical protein